MKRRVFLALILILVVLLSGCGEKEKENGSQESEQEENLLEDAVSKYPQELKDVITSCHCLVGEDGCLYTEVIVKDIKQFGAVAEKVVQSINELPNTYPSYNTRILFQGEYYALNWISTDNKVGTFTNTYNGDNAENADLQALSSWCSNTVLTGSEKPPHMMFEEEMAKYPDQNAIEKYSASSSEIKMSISIDVKDVSKFDDILKYAANIYSDKFSDIPISDFFVTYSENGEIKKSWSSEDGYSGTYVDADLGTYTPNYNPR